MDDARRRYTHERPDPTTDAPVRREGIRASGTVHLPRGWRALNIEETDSGTIVWVERRGIGGRFMDAAERGFRRWVWPYIGGKR